ncbi:MmyB family transcriptional regulator [Actinacidiphila acidipaludis]|uniref:Helix-turn-helix transcriptional regulator n=1 Tax=Actinacidiphila acidipaludis TaxID=2873382 RepID=A0ABS7Q9F6_9ACTN|nr:helix-turn-helix domain-containing protein [Streptomyces acidipaludis]MBY8879778.1 helix-turn-helix transcriptional regulator [Streptomyces acidipaludis]
MRNRQALQALLARARARVDPVELGLAPRADPRGRRVQGLTHEHMTRLLGWPEHKYGYVERGRLAHIGPDVLAPIARILHLSEHEWEAVVLYATGLLPAHPLDPRPGTAVPWPWERVLRTTDEIAYINDVAWDVVAYNTAFARLFRNHVVPGNTMRWMLFAPEARTVLMDWEHSWLPLLVPQLRNAVSAHPHNRTLARLQADARLDPAVAAAYDSPSQEFMGPRADESRPLLHAELGPGWATMCAAGPFGVPGGRLMFILFDPGERRPAPRPPLYAPAPGPVDPAHGSGAATA